MRRFSQLLPLLPLTLALAQSPSHAEEQGSAPAANPSNAARKEIERRKQLVHQAHEATLRAENEYSAGNYETAANLFSQVLSTLPETPSTSELRNLAKQGFARAATKQAEVLIENGQYHEARNLIQHVLSPEIAPRSKEALALQQELNNPDRYEPALTPEHTANVDKVSQLIRLADSYANIGNYDQAIVQYQEVLRIDKYNSTARRGMERVEQKKSQYLSTARDHYRSKALAQVDQQWEADVPRLDISNLFGAVSIPGVTSKRDSIVSKLNIIRLPRVDLQGTTLEEVVEFLRIRSRELDPDKKGIDFILRAPSATLSSPISLTLADVPLQEVLRYATEASGTVYNIDDFAVTISSISDQTNALITKTYRVPPVFMQGAVQNDSAASDPFGGGSTPGSSLAVQRLGAREYLEQRGVLFPEGATATYNASTGLLFIRNTASNVTLVDNLVEAVAGQIPKQVEVTIKMIEVTDTRLTELGFDWLMSPFNIPGSSRVFGSGATSNLTEADVAAIWPDGTPIGGASLTGGLRGAAGLEAAQSINSLLSGVNTVNPNARTPGTFALTGVFTDPQFQFIIRSLNQQKGVDVMAAPSVVTRSGQRANVTISREFPYPTEFDPPQIPQNLTTTIPSGNGNTSSGASDFAPITPSTPTTFEKRDVGIVLEVEPLISGDNSTIEVSLTPSSTQFEGFIDYGEDIQNSTPGIAGTRNFYTVTNDILQPIFSTNKINTAVTIYDGATIVLGGVMQEKVSNIHDKVPFLGDIPVIGRTFQSKAQKTEKKNMIFFVTVKIIDPAGKRINQPAEPEPTPELTAPPAIMQPLVEFSK